MPWHSLESIIAQTAVPYVWRKHLGDTSWPSLKPFLQPEPNPVTLYPCTHGNGCPHEVTHRPDASIVAVCRCPAQPCPDIPLTPDDIIAWRLSWPRLGHALCNALGLDEKHAILPTYNTRQIGSWSADAVPVILTIQTELLHFRNTVANLVAHLRSRFILLSPTARLADATSKALLANAGAALFSLETAVSLTPAGNLAPTRPPGELFGAFTPECEKRCETTPVKPRYALRKGLGVWHLIFDGKEADLRHERGIFYVAWLLHNPPEHPIHALDLIAKIPEIYRRQLGLPEITDPATGKVAPLQSGARIQERSLALDDAQTMRALFKKEKELEAILDSEDETEPVKAEALRELEEIGEFQRRHGRESRDSARRAAHAVRSAVRRLHRHLAGALGADGAEHAVLRLFADHIEERILIPSSRYCHGVRQAKGVAGCFTYEAAAGVSWSR